MYETLRSGRPHIGLRHTAHELKERLEGAPLRERPDIFYIFGPLRVKEDIVGAVAINLSRENLERFSPSPGVPMPRSSTGLPASRKGERQEFLDMYRVRF